MVIESKVTETRSINVELPYFCKHGDCFIKILDEKTCIKVDTYDFSTLIEIRSLDMTNSLLVSFKPCTEREFNSAFNQAFAAIQNQKEELV